MIKSKPSQFFTMLMTYSIFATGLSAQSTLDANDIKSNTSYFSIDNGFEGEGAELLKLELAQSQFIVYGELHNSKQSALIFDQLLKEAVLHGFSKLAVEVGPNSADILKKLSSNSEQTVEQLSGLYRKHNSKNYKYPIPFFKGVEDAEFLRTASLLNYDLWGLDQEYTLGAPMLFDELISTVSGSTNYEKIANAGKDAAKSWNKLKIKTRNCLSMTDPKIESFFQLFDTENTKAQSIISALKTSWKIYCYNEKGEYRSNNTERIAYMKSNFKQQFESDSELNGVPPKVIVKMGSYHTTKVKSPIGYQDVGNMIDGLAESLNKKAIYIRFMRRYWLGSDKLGAKDYKDVEVFMTVGKRDQWALIDMRPLQDKLKRGELTASKYEIAEIMNHDLMLIAPEDKWVKNNY